jgi:hypothetical protein
MRIVTDNCAMDIPGDLGEMIIQLNDYFRQENPQYNMDATIHTVICQAWLNIPKKERDFSLVTKQTE